MSNPFIEVMNQILPEPHASLINGMVWGIKSGLPNNLYQNLITTGTVHIVVLSGQNISILANVISRITLPLGRKQSILITIGGLIAFVLFVGSDPPIIRAVIMGSLSLVAVYFGRQFISLLALIFAGAAMLFVDPTLLISISFQLSFMATLGIILLGDHTIQKCKTSFEEIKRELMINMRTTLAAQLFTLPIILWYFKRISLIAPVSNLFISPMISPIMVGGLLASIAGFIYLPLGKLFGLLLWVPLHYLILVIDLTAKLPFAEIVF